MTTQRIGTFTCWLFGHKFVMHEFTKYLDEYDEFNRRARLLTLKHTEYCVRCGIRESSQ